MTVRVNQRLQQDIDELSQGSDQRLHKASGQLATELVFGGCSCVVIHGSNGNSLWRG